eukprot:TRINITY_DN13855_c0_g1_i1.p1 TRINITY_DN13855_c0_g1~~TRINITY_DN13855_c0_g1_i1.p1  ORF type:complete len:134 (+),score=17.63 TRINITY_DN13855_c0_g1_i1:153-554(+)
MGSSPSQFATEDEQAQQPEQLRLAVDVGWWLGGGAVPVMWSFEKKRSFNVTISKNATPQQLVEQICQMAGCAVPEQFSFTRERPNRGRGYFIAGPLCETRFPWFKITEKDTMPIVAYRIFDGSYIQISIRTLN